jgi:hypothetical protein
MVLATLFNGSAGQIDHCRGEHEREQFYSLSWTAP